MFPRYPHAASGPRRRRGSIYLYVLIISTLISLMGLSALMLTRIHREIQRKSMHASEARLYAQTALRIGMHRIKTDPDWRFTYPSGVWESDVPVGDGSYTLEGLDESDGDLSDRADEPITLIGTGMRGDSIHKMQVTLVPANRGFDCLKSAIHAGHTLKIDGTTLSCDHVGSSNDVVEANSATVHCDIQAVNRITGGTYEGIMETGIDSRMLPDSSTVLDFYLENGTWIDKDNLDIGYPNRLKNPGMESGTADWTADSCTISEDTSDVYAGSKSIKISDRDKKDDGMFQDITALLQNGITYEVEAWIRSLSPDDENYELHMVVESSGDGTDVSKSPKVTAKETDGWTQVTWQITPSWSGSLLSAELTIQTKNGGDIDDFLVDDFLMKRAGTERTIFGKLLSPASNPYGADTNPRGIYLIDMGDKAIFIENSRIVGTLVLIDPHSDSRVGDGGPLLMESAEPGLPALIVTEGNLTFDPSNAGLVENNLGVNFNPAGTPYADEDSDMSDTYPSEVQGLIYADHDIKFQNEPTIHGCVIADHDIKIEGPLELRYNPGYFYNPLPGFNGPEEIRVLLNSARKPL